jgi:hypothetical protein
MGIESDFEDVFREGWQVQNRLLAAPLTREWLLPIATPVLVFGRWQRAEVATVGINPFDREFLNNQRMAPLQIRRFLHRRAEDPVIPTQEMIATARGMMESYFETGTAYADWFRGFDPFLTGLARPFNSGLACHTDYLSPFATNLGARARTIPPTVRDSLLKDGLVFWWKVLGLMPNLRTVVGMGKGWEIVEDILGAGSWEGLGDLNEKRFARYQPPYLLHRWARIGGKPIQVFWWRPHFGDPLGGLSVSEKMVLGARIRGHIDSVTGPR